MWDAAAAAPPWLQSANRRTSFYLLDYARAELRGKLCSLFNISVLSLHHCFSSLDLLLLFRLYESEYMMEPAKQSVRLTTGHKSEQILLSWRAAGERATHGHDIREERGSLSARELERERVCEREREIGTGATDGETRRGLGEGSAARAHTRDRKLRAEEAGSPLALRLSYMTTPRQRVKSLAYFLQGRLKLRKHTSRHKTRTAKCLLGPQSAMLNGSIDVSDKRTKRKTVLKT